MSKPRAHQHLSNLAPYAVLNITGPAGKQIVQLGQNESAIPPSQLVLDAISAATCSPHLYAQDGDTPLRSAIAAAEGLDADRIICSAGSMDPIMLLAQCFLGPGTNAVMSQYGYLFFETAVKAAGADLVRASEKNCITDVDAILAAISSETRMVFLVNPTGAPVSSAGVKRLRASLPDNVLSSH